MQSPKLITTAIAVLAITACHPRPDRATFRTVMPLLELSEKVDSCLTVLRGIDTMSLTRPADKARWSLLYAMALDKNYIDTTDISVLQPAIDRYTHWTHRLIIVMIIFLRKLWPIGLQAKDFLIIFGQMLLKNILLLTKLYDK